MAAERFGRPINVALHITWSALVTGERQDGHILGLSAQDREKRLWAALRRVAKRAGVPWLAARGPEHDNGRGLHLHVVLHLPDIALSDAIDQVERLTGAPPERVDYQGWSERGRGGRQHHGIIGRSACRGWMLQRQLAKFRGDGQHLATYAAKGDGALKVDGQHRLSRNLLKIARQVSMDRSASRQKPMVAP